MEKKYLIIGPTQAGKTAMVASLFQAGRTWDREKKGIDVFVKNKNDAMVKLRERYDQTVKNGYLPRSGTLEATQYNFALEIKRKKMFSKWEDDPYMEVNFTFHDGPGEVFIPNEKAEKGSEDIYEIQKHKEKLIDELNEAAGFVLCIDSTNKDMALSLWMHLPNLFDQLNRTSPFERIVICMTKADDCFVSKGNNALSAIRETSPIEYVKENILGEVGLRTIKAYFPKTPIGFVWNSAYGFLESYGCPNFNPDRLIEINEKGEEIKGGLLMWGDDYDDVDVIDQWRPYNVIDPLLFLSVGRQDGIEILKK